MKKNKIKKEREKSSIKDKIKNIQLFKEDDEKATYSFKEMVFVMLFSLAIGFFACFTLYIIFNNGKDYRVLSKELSKLVDTYYALTDNYYEDIDKEVLVDDAIKGMLSSVDDVYTNYSDSDTTTTFMETVTGSYEGIGCTVGHSKEGQLIVVEVFDGGPAKKAGIKEDDIIIKIDGQDFTEKTSTDMANYIKQDAKEKLTITVERDGEEKEIEVKREKVQMPTVETEVYERNNKKVGYISISIFSSITNKQFKEALEKLNNENIDSLVIDVRDNGGGYLNVVTDIANMILEKDKIIYQLEKEKHTTIKKDNTKAKLDYPIAVLVNANSASASEILASAIKESYNGFVVGTNTYGKGTVQQTTTLPDGSMVKYTVQKWLTPEGNWINEEGLKPTDYVELNKEYYENPIVENDNQLNTALDLVSE